MIRAEYKDKERIVDILASSFDDNKSVNYIVKQDNRRSKRLRKLMEYSFDVCYLFGDIFLSKAARKQLKALPAFVHNNIIEEITNLTLNRSNSPVTKAEKTLTK